MNATGSRFNENRRRANRKVVSGFAARRTRWVRQRPTMESLEERTLLSFTIIPQPTAAYEAATTNMSGSIPADLTTTTTLSDGVETVTFDQTVTAATVPGTFNNWGSPPNTESATPRIVGSMAGNSLTLTLSRATDEFGLEMEPNIFGTDTMTATFYDGAAPIGTISQSVTSPGQPINAPPDGACCSPPRLTQFSRASC